LGFYDRMNQLLCIFNPQCLISADPRILISWGNVMDITTELLRNYSASPLIICMIYKGKACRMSKKYFSNKMYVAYLVVGVTKNEDKYLLS